MERYILKDNEARSRYEFDLGGHTAYIDYEKDNGTIVLTHTFVPEAYEGRGVGAQLVRRTGRHPQAGVESRSAVLFRRRLHQAASGVERHGERNGRRRTLTGIAGRRTVRSASRIAIGQAAIRSAARVVPRDRPAATTGSISRRADRNLRPRSVPGDRSDRVSDKRRRDNIR